MTKTFVIGSDRMAGSQAVSDEQGPPPPLNLMTV